MLSTTPPPRSRIESRHARVTLITPITLTSNRPRISLRDNTPNGWLYFIRCRPALLITMSIPPNRSTVAATAASTWPRRRRRSPPRSPCPLLATSSAAVRSAMSVSMSAITTFGALGDQRPRERPAEADRTAGDHRGTALESHSSSSVGQAAALVSVAAPAGSTVDSSIAQSVTVLRTPPEARVAADRRICAVCARCQALHVEQPVVDRLQRFLHAAVTVVVDPRPDRICARPEIDPPSLLPLTQPRQRTSPEVGREVSCIKAAQRRPECHQRHPIRGGARRPAATSPRRSPCPDCAKPVPPACHPRRSTHAAGRVARAPCARRSTAGSTDGSPAART